MNGVIVYISGGPGTGKSYTAEKMKDMDKDFRILSYDAIKEEFWDLNGFKNRQEKDDLNARALEEFYVRLDAAMKRKEKLICEYPFYQRHRERLKKITKDNDYGAVTIVLYGDRHVIYEREKKRNQSYDRHPGHVSDVYDLKEHDRKVEPIVYTEEEFWKLIEHKDYDIRIGKSFRVDVTDYDRIDLGPARKEIRRLLEVTYEQAHRNE